MLSFDMFLHTFETKLIETLSQRNLLSLQGPSKKPLISEYKSKALITFYRKELLKVLFRTYDESLFEQDLAKCLDKATNTYSMTAGFTVSNQDDKI
jgi:hypothetical protein